jgi:hypothetical protein
MKDYLKSAKDKQTQVLTHDTWWQKKIMSPKEKLFTIIDKDAQRKKDLYVNLLTMNSRKIIDWE